VKFVSKRHWRAKHWWSTYFSQNLLAFCFKNSRPRFASSLGGYLLGRHTQVARNRSGSTVAKASSTNGPE
jgi:hypothetical protein